MSPLARRLARYGYVPHPYSYPSVRLTLTENADRLAEFIGRLAAPVVHLVGHSAGGLVALTALDRHPQLPPGRVVLLGAPYGGSRAAEHLMLWRLGSYALGPNMLGRTVRDWIALQSRPAPAREIGVIAGRLPIGMGRIVGPQLDEENDGVICLSETAVPGMRERLVLNVSHSAMLVAPGVARAVCAFLANGRFTA
jgi:pimeloyl-ACP methyl ester carboxylesterase